MKPAAHVIIISTPKAGTWMLSELVERMGFHNTFCGLGPEFTDCYDAMRLEDGRKDLLKFRAIVPFKEAVKFVRSGEVAWTHECDKTFLAEVKDFRKVFIRREMRSVLLSYMRFNIESQREDVRSYNTGSPKTDMITFLNVMRGHIAGCNRYTTLLSHPDVFCIRYEDIRQKRLDLCNELADFLGGYPVTMEDIDAVFATETLTSSRKKCHIEEYWSDEAEELFREMGGHRLNIAWGYEPEPDPLRRVLDTFPTGLYHTFGNQLSVFKIHGKSKWIDGNTSQSSLIAHN